MASHITHHLIFPLRVYTVGVLFIAELPI